MIRALLCQLLLGMEDVPDDIQTFYNKHQEATSTRPSTQLWTKLFCTHLQKVDNVFIFIDALDECAEAETSLLRDSLSNMLSGTDDDVRWLLTCRPDDRIMSDLHGIGFKHTIMETETVDKDIETYLTATLKADSKLSSFRKDARDCIIAEITSKSVGMFRYAQCQLETIAKLRDRRIKKVKEVLRTMPHTISESYHRILSDAQQLDDWPILERILLLVSFSTRPVTVAEVSEFAILEDDMTALDPEDRLDISDALSTIDTLITVRGGYVTLSHKSVQDFFADGSEPYHMFYLCQNADAFIAKKCLMYLRFMQEPVVNIAEAKSAKEPNTGQLKKLLQEYPLLDYAATRWPHHLREKHLQEEVMESMAATLPLTSKPNLWKAWLLLQRADIWENQIQLAETLCESFIRGALVTNWSQNFWQERQAYRLRNDATSQITSKPLLTADKSNPKAIEAVLTSVSVAQAYVWVRAVEAQSSAYSAPEPLLFEKGDIILVKKLEPANPYWTGYFNGRTGTMLSSRVEVCPSNTNPRLSGTLYHELAILLLEVAFQTSLSLEAMAIWMAISNVSDLAQYLGQLRELTSRSVRKMGLQYGKIIDECLSNVHWLDQRKTDAPARDVHDSQDSCMEKVCKPLVAIRSSGFRASRSPVKRNTKVANSGYPPYSYGTISANVYPPLYQSTTAADSMSFGSDRYGSAPPAAYGRATSAEPRYMSSATVVSQTAAYYTTSSPTGVYRPHSTSAVAVSYTTSTSAYMIARPESADTISAFRPFSQSPAPATLPATGRPLPLRAGSMSQGTTLAIMDTVVETKDEETGREDPAAVQVPTGGEHVPIPADARAPTDADASMSKAQGASDDYINRDSLSWWFPADLTYSAFPDQRDKPTDILSSDEEMAMILEAAHAAVLVSSDAETQLLWARDALEHVTVGEDNRMRAMQALSIRAQPSEIEQGLQRDATSIVDFLAGQEHLDALYIQAKWWEFGRFGYELDKQKSLEQYKMISDKGHAGACYRAGVALEASQEVLEAFKYYRKGSDAKSAGALYRRAIQTMQGVHGEIKSTQRSMELLFDAAEVADGEAPQALYVLGLIFAHEFPVLSGTDNPAPLDNKRAVDYLKRAAFFGFSKAQLRLATAYELCQLGLEYSLSLALHYYILAARRGQPEAELGISKIMLYVDTTAGVGESTSMAGAAYAFAKRAALDNLVTAQFAVGYYHETGVHVAVDKEQALAWYEKAAAQGSTDAIEAVARLQRNDIDALKKDIQHTTVDVDTELTNSWQPGDDTPLSGPTKQHETAMKPETGEPDLITASNTTGSTDTARLTVGQSVQMQKEQEPLASVSIMARGNNAHEAVSIEDRSRLSAIVRGLHRSVITDARRDGAQKSERPPGTRASIGSLKALVGRKVRQ